MTQHTTDNAVDIVSLKGRQSVANQVSLKEISKVLWIGKWKIVGITALISSIFVVVVFSLPNIYSSSALLAPSESSGGGMSSLLKQYGGLASLAGISLPGAGDDSKAGLATAIMKSRAFVGDFIERRGIMHQLMAVEKWDNVTGSIEFDSDIYDVDTDTWVRDVDPPFTSKPSLLEAHEEFMEILSISEDKETGFVTIQIKHQSPIIAQQWVTWLIEDINRVMRDQDVAEANLSITYLREQIANTPLSELRTIFFELIQSQTETIMLAKVRPEYVFKTIDPATVPEEKSSPRRMLLCILGAILGGMVAVFWVLLRHYSFRDLDKS